MSEKRRTEVRKDSKATLNILITKKNYNCPQRPNRATLHIKQHLIVNLKKSSHVNEIYQYQDEAF